MEISVMSIIISAVALLLSIVSPLFSPLFRVPRPERKTMSDTDDSIVADDNDNDNDTTPVSIVIVAHDNAAELERSLPLFLAQEYDADYQVIIVADKSDSETDDVIKRFSGYKNLYATFIPASSRYVSRKKLAVTLGIKAAKHPWVIVTDAWCHPKNTRWLGAFAANCKEGKDLVLGYTAYDKDAPARYIHDHAANAAYHLWFAARGRAISTDSPLIAIRKKRFIQEKGFLGNLKYARGEYAFIVNKYSAKGNTAIALSGDSFLEEDTPLRKRWTNRHLFDINARESLHGMARQKALYIADIVMMFLCNVTIVASVVYGIYSQDWIVSGSGIMAFILQYILRSLLSRKALDVLSCNVSFLLIPLMEFTQPFCDLSWRIRYCFADKYDFITHKI